MYEHMNTLAITKTFTQPSYCLSAKHYFIFALSNCMYFFTSMHWHNFNVNKVICFTWLKSTIILSFNLGFPHVI